MPHVGARVVEPVFPVVVNGASADILVGNREGVQGLSPAKVGLNENSNAIQAAMEKYRIK